MQATKAAQASTTDETYDHASYNNAKLRQEAISPMEGTRYRTLKAHNSAGESSQSDRAEAPANMKPFKG